MIALLPRAPRHLAALLLLSIFLVSAAAVAQTQDGWDLIARNDNRAAREAFTAALAGDSTHQAALRGMIYLSEIEGDAIPYYRYINTLISNYWDDPIYRLFKTMYQGKPDSVIRATTLSRATLTRAWAWLAEERRSKRKFEEAESIYRREFGNLQWSLIGPFKNVAGSGYDITFPPETSTFDTAARYRDETGLDLKWITPRYCAAEGYIDFTYHLPESNNEVYFANTFFETSASGPVQIRLGRSAPVKVWLDDALVYEARDPVSLEYDGEFIQVNIRPGIHRLLIKVATAYSSYNEEGYDLLKFFDHMNFTQEELVVRITDTTGALLPDLRSHTVAEYSPARYSASLRGESTVEYFRRRIEEQPDDLFHYYALCKAYMQAGNTQEAEEYFVRMYNQRPETVFFKYLAAKALAANGKIEQAYEALNGIDQEKTPVFDLLFEKFTEIDLDNEEERFLTELQRLRTIAPSNWAVVMSQIRYYRMRDRDVERDAYIDSTIALYPLYKESLSEMKSEKEKERMSISESERRAIIDSLSNYLEDNYKINDYFQLISYYQDEKEVDRTIELFDELIAGNPHVPRFHMEKASYLFEEKEYDEAREAAEMVLSISPYHTEALEMVGDTYNEQKEKGKALEYYRRVRRLNPERGSLFGYNSVGEKIEKLEGARNYKALFTTPSFDDVLNNPAWQALSSNEESVVLMYTQDMILDTTHEVRIYRRMMVKILTEAGANYWTEFNFRFFGSIDAVRVIKENGAEITPDRRGGMVVFKNLAPGDLIQVEGQATDMASHHLDNEYFDLAWFTFDHPTYYTKYQVLVPEGRYLGYLHHRLEDNVVRSTVGAYDSYLWEYENLPRIESETALLDEYDPYRTIFISTMPDWSRVVEWYRRMTYRKTEPTYDIRAIVDDLIQPGMSDSARVVTIYNYITREINYSSVPFLQSAYVPKKPNLTLSAQIGDCKDVATLMITMLAELGIEAHYVLVKTNHYDHQNMLPSLFFDHVIVACNVDGDIKYMDLTTDFYPHYVLPESDAGALGLPITEGNRELITLPTDFLDPAKNLAVVEIDAALLEDRALTMKASADYPGVWGGRLREQIYSASQDEVRNLILASAGGETFSDLRLADWTFENQFEITEPLRAAYSFDAPRYSDRVSNLLIFRLPYLVSIPTSKAMQSPQRKNTLSLPELAEIRPIRQIVTLHFPKGYALTEFPTDINIRSPYGTYTVTYKKTADGMRIEKYQEFTRDRIPADEFEKFKEFYLRILDADAAKYAVMKKKS